MHILSTLQMFLRFMSFLNTSTFELWAMLVPGALVELGSIQSESGIANETSWLNGIEVYNVEGYQSTLSWRI